MLNGRRWLGVLLVALVFALAGTTAAWAQSFSDVQEDDWFLTPVEELSAAGIVQGYGDGTFHPYDTVTRAQFAAMMDRALPLPDVQEIPFADVALSDWYYPSVGRLYNAGLIFGLSATSFAPESGIAREQAASMVLRALNHRLSLEPVEGLSLDISQEEVQAWLGTVRDRWYVSDSHRANVANAIRFSIMTGSDDQRFYPMLTLTRAQAAGIVHRALFVPVQGATETPVAVPPDAYGEFRRGSSGPMVTYLQERLASLGYNVGTIDGQYGESTKDAVMAFQKVERLTRDGEAGPEVWGALVTGQRPTPRLSRSGTRVEIDLTKQVLFYIQNDVVTEILPISSGAPGWETRPGTFRVFRKVVDWERSPLGFLYYPSYFDGGIAIHGAWDVPPWPASHGCVRIPVWATVSLYNRLFYGIVVDVYFS